MQPEFIVDAPQSKFINEAKPPGPPLVPKAKKKMADLDEIQNASLIPDLTDFIEDDFEHPKVLRRAYIKFGKWITRAVLLSVSAISIYGLIDVLELF